MIRVNINVRVNREIPLSLISYPNLGRSVNTPGMRQSKTLSTIDERGSKIDRNSVFDCHLSPMWRQLAIENSVSYAFRSTFLDSIGAFDCRLPGVVNFPQSLIQGSQDDPLNT